MLGFKRCGNAAITIADIELMRRMRKGQVALPANLKHAATPAAWCGVLSAGCYGQQTGPFAFRHETYIRAPQTTPPKPGLKRALADAASAAIAAALWEMALRYFCECMRDVPAQPAIGLLELANGRWASGSTREAVVIHGAQDSSHFCGWCAYLESKCSHRWWLLKCH